MAEPVAVDPGPDVAGVAASEGALFQPLLDLRDGVVDGHLFAVHVEEPRVVLDQLQHHVRLRVRVTAHTHTRTLVTVSFFSLYAAPFIHYPDCWFPSVLTLTVNS